MDFCANAVTPVAVNSNEEKITLGYEEVGERWRFPRHLGYTVVSHLDRQKPSCQRLPKIGASSGPLSWRFKGNPWHLRFFFRFWRIWADSHANAATSVAVDGNEANVTPRYGGGGEKDGKQVKISPSSWFLGKSPETNMTGKSSPKMKKDCVPGTAASTF